jgi:hypothetical protein
MPPRPRAFTQLATLAEPDLLAALAEGMTLIAEHVVALETAAQHQTGPYASRAAAAIRVVVDDEAGKYLILLDVTRCVREPARNNVEQLLKRCRSHRAKGIHASTTDMRPATYEELIRYVDRLSQSYYLDGQNDVDWIYANEIESRREGRLYVDLVKTDEGLSWISPPDFETRPSSAARLVTSMHQAGFSTPTGLSIVADVWQGFAPENDTDWREVASRSQVTLERMEAEGVLSRATKADLTTIVDTWTYPLHQAVLQTTSNKTKDDALLNDLGRLQREWEPDL